MDLPIIESTLWRAKADLLHENDVYEFQKIHGGGGDHDFHRVRMCHCVRTSDQATFADNHDATPTIQQRTLLERRLQTLGNTAHRER